MRRRSTLGERGDFVLLPTAQAPSRPSPRDLAVLDESLSADNALLKGVPRPAGIDEPDSAPIGRFAASIADAVGLHRKPQSSSWSCAAAAAPGERARYLCRQQML